MKLRLLRSLGPSAIVLLSVALASCGSTGAAPAQSAAAQASSGVGAAPSAASSGVASARAGSGSPAAAASSAGTAGSGNPASSGGAAGSGNAASSGGSGPASGQAVKLKVANLHITADAGLYIAQDKGYFKQQGLDVQFVDFSTAGDTIAPLSAGQIDVGAGAISAGLFNAVARGLDLKIVADKGQHKPVSAGFSSSLALVISKKAAQAGTFKTLADLKGKTIAMTSTGSGTEITVDKALQKVGLTLKDVTIKPMPFPDMLPALANGSIDVANEIEPFVAQAEAKGIGVAWMKSENMYPGQQGGVLMYGPTMAKLGDAGDRFMVAYIQGLRDYNRAFGPKLTAHDAVISTLIAHTKVKDRALYDKMGWDYLDPNGQVNEKAISDDLDWYVAHGYTKQKPDMAKIVDSSYADRADKQLGPYQP